MFELCLKEVDTDVITLNERLHVVEKWKNKNAVFTTTDHLPLLSDKPLICIIVKLESFSIPRIKTAMRFQLKLASGCYV